jgi:hypothetical protein
MVQERDPLPAAPPVVEDWVRSFVAPPPLSDREIAAARARAELLKREPWRDPTSEHYDPLRVARADRPDHFLGASKMVAAVVVLALTACTPDPVYITRPVYIDRVQQVVQPIPAELLQPHAIAEGLPSQCPSIAAQRRAELEACNADKAAIRAIAGAKEQGDE